jgi:hypothetical protein
MLTEIFCILDDFCKEFEKENKKYFLEAVGNNKRNRQATLTPGEILTILVFFHYSGQRTFKNYYEVTLKMFYKDAFGKLVSYNRFLDLAQKHLLLLTVFAYSYKASEDCVFYGKIVKFLITPGNVSDQDYDVVNFLTKNIFGKLFGDKGYISASLFKKLFARGLQIITKIRRNMKNILMDFTDKILLQKRGVVESVGNLLKNKLQIEHSRHRSVIGFFINVMAATIAYNFLPKKPSFLSAPLFLSYSTF